VQTIRYENCVGSASNLCRKITINIFVTFVGLCFFVFCTIRYDSVYLTCSKKLTGSQLSPPHGTNKKLKCETKNKNKLYKNNCILYCRQKSYHSFLKSWSIWGFRFKLYYSLYFSSDKEWEVVRKVIKRNKKKSPIVVTYYTNCCLNHSVYHLRGYSSCLLFIGTSRSTLTSNVVSLNGLSCFCCTRSFVEMWLLTNKFNAEPATTVTVRSYGKQF